MAPQPFQASGPLPGEGITVIEASAGTGKTYTLTSLVLRFVADGVPLSALLAVTFTKMATGELRDRVRSRLVEAHRALSDHLGRPPSTPGSTGTPDVGGVPGVSGGPDLAEDAVVAMLAEGTREQVEQRCGRLADALADFDAATITTTHGFCQLVLHGLGTAGDAVPGTTLLEDPADLMEEVIDDLYLRRSLLHPQHDPPFSLTQARHAAFEVTRNPDAHLVPPPGDDEAGLLRRLAEKAGQDIGRRLLEEARLTYDHLLFRLARTLEDPVRGPEACRRLGERYQVVLVDEFQDTDPVQWTVLRRAFTGGPTRLVLIGDPKQAVYAFRGADVHAYLDAARTAGAFYTLDTNWRADQPLLDATAALFDPLQFGHPSIPFRSVRAPSDRQTAGLRGDGCAAPMRWRLVADHQPGISVTKRGLLSKSPLRDCVALDLAGDVARLLTSGAELVESGAWRPLVEKDVAVLTRTNAQALAVRDALRRAGVASVVAGLDSVFRSDGADAWLRLLEALQEPASRSRASAVALGPFFTMTWFDAVTASEGVWESVHERLHRWAAILSARGVAALYRRVTVEQGLPGRLLVTEGGERMLTDLGHVAQLLHAEASAAQLGAPSLRNWLAARIRSVADERAEAEDRSRRLDSDAEAVQVLTVHGAKGLEFPVVYCPYMWDAGPPERGSAPVVFHDPSSGGARTLDGGCPVAFGPAHNAYVQHAALARTERRGEDLRLLYVALTRARHRLVIWWGRTQECRHSPLGRLLVGRDGMTGEVRDSKGGEPTAKQIRSALDAIAARASGLVQIEEAAGPGPATVSERTGRDGAAAAALVVAPFDRHMDQRWRRASYSSITAAAHDGGAIGDPVASEPEGRRLSDEPALADGVGAPGLPFVAAGTPVAMPARALSGPGAVPEGLHRASPLADVAGGPLVGTFVHRVLEDVDFAAPDLPGALGSTIAECARREGAPPGLQGLGGGLQGLGGGLQGLGSGLQAALTTPLGPLLPGTALADISRADRLDELGFELPVAGGESPIGSVTTAAIADVVERHTGDRLPGYAERLRDPLLDTTIRGYLTGSLDLVFRSRSRSPSGTEGPSRWYVADYKTNWLGGAALVIGDYRGSALDAEMERRHYPLQALIYMVALHRYLRWRQEGYRPGTHLGGVLYLFLRGMAGPDTPVMDGSPCGVWSWAVPPQLVVELSDLFDTGDPPAVSGAAGRRA